MGAFLAFVLLIFVGGRLSIRNRYLLFGLAILIAVILELTIWPMNDAYDPRRTLAGAMGGAIGGLVGGGIGALFGHLREGKKISLIVPLAVLGFLGAELADIGSTQAGKGLVDAILPPLQRPGASDMSFDEFRAKLLKGSDFKNSGMAQAVENDPQAMDVYFRWLHQKVSAGEAEGLTQSQIEERIFLDAGRMTDDLLLRADKTAVTEVLKLRVDMVHRLAEIDPSYCVGSFNVAAINDPRVKEMIVPLSLVVLARLLPFEGQPKKTQLPQTDFMQMSEMLLTEVFAEVGEAVLVFIGEVPVTADNQADYCAAENAFLTKINDLPGGGAGSREAYYQTLTATVLASQ